MRHRLANFLQTASCGIWYLGVLVGPLVAVRFSVVGLVTEFPKYYALIIISALLGVLFLARALRLRHFVWQKVYLGYPLLILWGAITLSALVAPNGVNAWLGLADHLRLSWVGFTALLVWYVAGIQLLTEESQIIRAVKIFLVGSAVAAGSIVWSLIFKNGRGLGTIVSDSTVLSGIWFGVVAIFCAVLSMAKQWPQFWRVSAGVLGVIFLGAAILFIFPPNSNISKILKLPAGQSLWAAPAETFLQAEDSFKMTNAALSGSFRRLILGTGFNGFNAVFDRYHPESFNKLLSPDLRFDRAGSEAVEWLAVTGWGGVSAFVLFISTIILYGLTRRSRPVVSFSQDDYSKRAAPVARQIYFSAWVALLALSISGFLFPFTAAHWILGWWLLVLIGTSARLTFQEETFRIYTITSRGARFIYWCFLFIALGCFLAGASYALRWYRSSSIMDRLNSVSIEERIIILNQAQKIFPRRLSVYSDLAGVEVELAGRSVAQNNFRLAYEHSNRAVDAAVVSLNFFPTDRSAWELYAATLSALPAPTNDNLIQIIRALETAKNLSPRTAEIYFGLGQAYENTGSTTLAMENFAEAVRLKPTADYYYRLGRVYVNRNSPGDYYSAETLFLQAINLAPGHSDALYALGILYQLNHRPREALKYFQRVLEINPSNAEVIRRVTALRAVVPR